MTTRKNLPGFGAVNGDLGAALDNEIDPMLDDNIVVPERYLLVEGK